MCGIAGVLSRQQRGWCANIAERMTAALVHRGPDGSGSWAEDGFAFGMRRLSIIDLEGGQQPIRDPRTGLRIVMNGEIYNYRALRESWTAAGEAWQTRSDTEVALTSFARAGFRAIESWNGMFAVALWDEARQELTLVRDRMGVKPLYYYWDGEHFLFASETSALLASGLVPRRISRQAVWDYLTYRYVPGPQTIWESVYKLPPGHALRIRCGGPPQADRYWSSRPGMDVGAGGSALGEFEPLFLSAVELRLLASDVPVGMFLSGGLDSSAIAAAAVELGHRQFHAFSVGYASSSDSELPFAEQVARHVGARHHTVVLDHGAFAELLGEAAAASDEPLADLTCAPLLALARSARSDLKVVLSGEGADEVLAGYDLDRQVARWARASRIKGLARLPISLALALAPSGARLAPRLRRLDALARLPLPEWNRLETPFISRCWSEESKAALWPSAWAEDSERIVQAQYRAAVSDDPLQQMLEVYQQDWLVEDLLMKADKMCMAASLEARAPFLDYRLVEWANRQPTSVKVGPACGSRLRTKAVLRQFCERRLPPEIVNRPKRGFPIPSSEWLMGGLRGWGEDLLLGSGSRVGGCLARQAITASWMAAQGGRSTAAAETWNLIALELWLRAHNAELPRNEGAPRQSADWLRQRAQAV